MSDETFADLKEAMEVIPKIARSLTSLEAVEPRPSEVAAAGREVFANLYAYCVRQLAYSDTNKDCAVILLKVAMRGFEST